MAGGAPVCFCAFLLVAKTDAANHAGFEKPETGKSGCGQLQQSAVAAGDGNISCANGGIHQASGGRTRLYDPDGRDGKGIVTSNMSGQFLPVR